MWKLLILTSVGPLANKKETILRERDRLQAEVEELDKRLHMQRLYSENVEKFRQDAEAVNTTLMQELEVNQSNFTEISKINKINFVFSLVIPIKLNLSEESKTFI